jgi:Tol biopolymer transport system component
MRSKIIPVMAVIVLVLIAAYFLSQPVSCFFWLRSAPQNLIVFSNQSDLYLMDAQGSTQCRIAEGNFESPAWSPDGRQIAFVDHSKNEVYVINADGSGMRRVGEGNDNVSLVPPSWSADSTELAYVGTSEEGNATIAIVNVANNETRYLDDPRESVPIAVSWSPDGTQIAFINADDETFVVPSAGGEITHLSLNANHTTRAQQWLPDSQRFVFVEVGFELALANTQDDSVLELTTLIEDNIGGIFDFALAPSGDRAALAVLEDGNTHIYLFNLTTGELSQLTDGNYQDWGVAWTNDESALIVERYDDFSTTSSIYHLNLSTQEMTLLATGHEPLAQPTSPLD